MHRRTQEFSVDWVKQYFQWNWLLEIYIEEAHPGMLLAAVGVTLPPLPRFLLHVMCLVTPTFRPELLVAPDSTQKILALISTFPLCPAPTDEDAFISLSPTKAKLAFKQFRSDFLMRTSKWNLRGAECFYHDTVFQPFHTGELGS